MRKLAARFWTLLASAVVLLTLVSPAGAQFRKIDDVSLENLIDGSKVALATLDQIGQPISDADRTELEKAWAMSGDAAQGKIQEIMDRYCLLEIRIDEEAWLSAFPASNNPSDRQLVKGKWRAFLVKVYNESPVKADVLVRSPQTMSPEELEVAENGEAPPASDPHGWYRWLGLQIYPEAVQRKEFVGSMVRYMVLGIFSRDEGMRAADLEFYFGGGAVSQGHYVNRRMLFEIVAPGGKSLNASPHEVP